MTHECPICKSEIDYRVSKNKVTVFCLNSDCRIKRDLKFLRMTKLEAIQVAIKFWKSND